jgi:hypothetical protein
MVDDTGWHDVQVAEGFTFTARPQVRRIGDVVYWRGDVVGNFAPGFRDVTVGASIPPWAFPPRSERDTQKMLADSSFRTVAMGVVTTPNGVRIATESNADKVRICLAGLSGYTTN